MENNEIDDDKNTTGLLDLWVNFSGSVGVIIQAFGLFIVELISVFVTVAIAVAPIIGLIYLMYYLSIHL